MNMLFSGVENVHADHAASHLGKAEGLARLVRGVPHNAARRNVLLPRDIMVHDVLSITLLVFFLAYWH